MSLKNQFSNHFIVYLTLFFFLNQITNSQSKRSSKKDILTIPESTYESLKYRSIGPHRGGRSSAVTGVPGKPNLYYFGSAGGGVWKTEDGGETFKNISDGFFGGSIGSISVSINDPNIIYVGGGEVTVRGNVSSGYGIWKSDNADIFRKHLKACSCDHPCNIGGNLAKNPQLSNILPEYSPSPYTG